MLIEFDINLRRKLYRIIKLAKRGSKTEKDRLEVERLLARVQGWGDAERLLETKKST